MYEKSPDAQGLGGLTSDVVNWSLVTRGIKGDHMEAWRVDNIEIAALSADEWQVSEPTGDDDTHLAVLGLVHRVDEDFEISETGEDELTTVGSLVSAIDYLATHGKD